MKAVVMTSKGVRFEEREIPVPGAGEVLVQSVSCGICEGEVYRYNKLRETGSGEVLTLGHEGSGLISATGPGVTGLRPGDAVTTSLGGAYGEYFVVPSDRLVRLPSGVSPEWAVGEAVACCAYSAKNARIRPGDRVAVIGCGFMGLLITAFAKILYKAGNIAAIDPVSWRSEMAGRYGADVCVTCADPLDADSFDVVIEAAGAPGALYDAGKLAAEHGRLTIVGYHQSHGGLRSVNMRQWNLKALEVTSGHCRRPLWKRQELEQVLPVLESGQVDLKGLVTSYAFADIEQAFHDISTRKEGLVKAAVQFEA